MLTPARIAVVAILLLIAGFASWSKLRLADPEDHQPQRWRVEEYPGRK